MAFWNRLFRNAAGTPRRDPLDPKWYGNLFPWVRTRSRIQVDQHVALTLSACWAATRIYAETLSSLPRMMYRCEEMKNGRIRYKPAKNHPTSYVFTHEFNPAVSADSGIEMMVDHGLNWGNFFALKEFESSDPERKRVSALWPIHPSRVPVDRIRKLPGGKLVYEINKATDPGGWEPETVTSDNLFHVPGPIPSANGYCGRSVVEYLAENIGQAIAVDRYQAAFFGNGAHVGTVIEAPNKLTKPEYERLSQQWFDKRGVDRAFNPMILENGQKLTKTIFNPTEAGVEVLKKLGISDIARGYNLPVHLLRDMTQAGVRANVEDENRHFVLLSLLPWAVTRIERPFGRQLLGRNSQGLYQFKIKLNALLRGDMKARAEFYTRMFQMGVFVINDMLELEDMEPSEDEACERRFVPVNMQTIETCLATEEKTIKEAAIDPMEKLKMEMEAKAKQPAAGTGRPDPSGGNRKPTAGASTGGADKMKNRIPVHLLNRKRQARKKLLDAVRVSTMRESLAMIEGIESTQLKAWAETPLEERASTFVNRTSKFYDEELPKLLKEVLHETTDVHNNAASSFIAERKKLIERLTAKPIKDLPSEIEPALKSETSLLTAILG
jgi:HK97 family phage portal protein